MVVAVNICNSLSNAAQGITSIIRTPSTGAVARGAIIARLGWDARFKEASVRWIDDVVTNHRKVPSGSWHHCSWHSSSGRRQPTLVRPKRRPEQERERAFSWKISLVEKRMIYRPFGRLR